jgi:hypothetical protein
MGEVRLGATHSAATSAASIHPTANASSHAGEDRI